MICLLISACAALFAFATRSSCLARRVRRVEKIADGGFLLAFSGLLAKVAMADGTVTADEVETVEKMFAEMGLSRAERAMCIGNFYLVQREADDPRERARALAASMNRVACLLLYALLWRVANADQRIDAGEVRLLEDIGIAFGFEDDLRAKFRAGDVPSLDRKALEDAAVPKALARLWTH